MTRREFPLAALAAAQRPPLDLLPEEEYRFHATAIFASGGMVLSADDLTKIPVDRLATLRKLLPPAGVAARFEDDSLRVGVIELPGRRAFCVFNWGDQPQSVDIRLPQAAELTDYWSGVALGRHGSMFRIEQMPPHSARLIAAVS